MTKIEELLKKLGASDDLVKEIMESLDQYKKDVKDKLEVEFKDRVGKARQVCIEAVEKEKQELCRKVEIFLESRQNTITREATKQAAIGETKSVKTLREVRSLVEGVNIGEEIPADHQAAIAELKKLRVTVQQLSEAKDKSDIKASRANSIALKALDRIKILEGRPAPTQNTVTEGKEKVGQPSLESLRKPKNDTQTTRRPLVETVVKPTTKQTITESEDPQIKAIADSIDNVPAFVQR